MADEGLGSQMALGMELKNFYAAARRFAEHVAMLERKSARNPEDIYGEEEDMRKMVHLMVDLDIRMWRVVLSGELSQEKIEKELRNFFLKNGKAHDLEVAEVKEIIQGVGTVVNVLQQVRRGAEELRKTAS